MFHIDEKWPASGDIEGRARTHPQMPKRIRGAAASVDLMEKVFEGNARTRPRSPIRHIRDRALDQLRSVPVEFKRLRNPEVYRVLLSLETARIKETLMDYSDA